MDHSFAENLRKLREKNGLSQKQLGKQMFVNPSTIANWESGRRLPDAVMVLRLAKCLGVDANTLLQLEAQSEKSPNVIMVDDSEIILTGGMSVLNDILPNATIAGFIWPTEAIEYAKLNRIDLAILDIELGTSSGFDLCGDLLKINPFTNILFLTAYIDYSYDAWKTEASGFILKPLTSESVKEQLKKLRYPFQVGGSDK
ncbi:MAG: helix-turn-helix domain-containing protein [Lachnospiraceae bacterium]|nr:helix-turn-helix domain-containing protein [Lachnospiraceae bacterium]